MLDYLLIIFFVASLVTVFFCLAGMLLRIGQFFKALSDAFENQLEERVDALESFMDREAKD